MFILSWFVTKEIFFQNEFQGAFYGLEKWLLEKIVQSSVTYCLVSSATVALLVNPASFVLMRIYCRCSVLHPCTIRHICLVGNCHLSFSSKTYLVYADILLFCIVRSEHAWFSSSLHPCNSSVRNFSMADLIEINQSMKSNQFKC